MEVKQISTILNSAYKQTTGQEGIVKDDLSNLVDVGTTVLGSRDIEKYSRSLADQIGIIQYQTVKSNIVIPSVYRTASEYASIIERVKFASMPEVEDDDTYTLTDGTVYEQDKFTAPALKSRFFNSKKPFFIPISFSDRMLKSAFASPTQMEAFVSFISDTISNQTTNHLNRIIYKLLADMIALTAQDKTGMQYVNLIKLYKEETGQTTTVDKAFTNALFLKFASMTISKFKDRLTKDESVLFNSTHTVMRTDEDSLNIVLISDFAKAATFYLESNTFNRELVALPKAITVPYWQGSGTDYKFANTGTINITSKNVGADVTVKNIVGVMFDTKAIGVANQEAHTTSHRNDKGEFTNLWYKGSGDYFTDCDENFVVFYLADLTE